MIRKKTSSVYIYTTSSANMVCVLWYFHGVKYHLWLTHIVCVSILLKLLQLSTMVSALPPFLPLILMMIHLQLVSAELNGKNSLRTSFRQWIRRTCKCKCNVHFIYTRLVHQPSTYLNPFRHSRWHGLQNCHGANTFPPSAILSMHYIYFAKIVKNRKKRNASLCVIS